MGAAPVLETARLLLRPFSAGDLDAQAAMMADASVMTHLGGPIRREAAWRKLLGAAGMWAFLPFGYWAIERRGDARMIGQIGFADFKRDLVPAVEGVPEMGWLFAAEAGGQGFATEAGRAALAWIDEALAPPEVVAIVDAHNDASIRVAGKLGFATREDASYRGEPIQLFRRRGPAA